MQHLAVQAVLAVVMAVACKEACRGESAARLQEREEGENHRP